MRRISLCIAAAMACGLAACATRGAGPEVAAVVQDEQARQAAATSAQQGESATDALKAGAQAAAKPAPPT